MIRKTKLADAVKLALMASAAASLTLSLPSFAAEQDDEAKDEQKIVVTGSRIKRNQLEGASPVTVITAEDIENEGFTTVYEALRSITEASGSVQGEQYTNSFTPNAMMINLRGMGPGYTLVLLNGKRVADYPMPYNSQSNFFNLAQIPAAAIERIEVLSGGASAIYGSDAVAGVINIITRKNVDDITLSARIGTTTQGGGDSERIQAVGGISSNKFNWTWTFEYYHTDPIYGKDRDWLDSYDDRPDWDPENDVVINTRSLLFMEYNGGWQYIDPGSSACDPFVDLEYSFRPGSGYYCGRDSTGDESLRSEREWLSFYNSFTYDLDSNAQLYGRLMLWDSEAKSQGFRLWWGSPFPYVDLNRGSFAYLQRVFQPSETGEQVALFNEQSVDISFGINGLIGNDMEYDVSVSHSMIDFDRERTRFKEEAINAFFLGDYLGDFNGYDMYAPDMNRFYTPLTPDQVAQLTGIDDTGAESEASTLYFSLTGDLFELDGGMAQFAAVAEYATQSYDINLHPRLLNQEGAGWWGLTGTGGGGERDRYAVGGEFRLPFTDELVTTIAARYDLYDDITQVDGAVTYNVGFEWRPQDNLLIRAMGATSFRAPDMHYVFADESGFYTTVNDVYRCRTEDNDPSNDSYADCDISAQIFATRKGNPELEEETGETYTIGFVVEPTENLYISMDYYRVKLENKITDESLVDMLEQEADCRMGLVDQNSGVCQRLIGDDGRIIRNPDDGSAFANALQQMSTDPVNSEFKGQTGIDVRVKYNLETEYGRWIFDNSYSHTLKSFDSEAPDVYGWRDHPWNFDARSKYRGTITWLKDDWSVTLLGNRLGSMPNWGETGRIRPWITYNTTVQYNLTNDSVIGLAVQNLRDSKPPRDVTFTSWPYFYRGQYNAIGREVFLTYRHTF